MPSLLFDARLLLSTPTGIGTYISSLFPELLVAAPDIHFHLLLPPHVWEGYAVADWNAPNLTVHTRSWRHMSVQQQWLVPRLASELGVNLIHYPHFDAPVWYGSVPIVATIHDTKYLLHPEFFPRMGNVKRLYMRFAFWATLQRAARVIAVSHATASDLARLFTVPMGRIRMIHEAPDPSFTPDTAQGVLAFRQRYGITRPYILSVGELRPHKNHRTVIEAFAESTARATHDVVIIGRPHGTGNDLAEVAAANGVAGQVHILTDVDPSQLRAAYTGAALFMLLSLYEGFGLPVLEAMACGVPVIGSNSTSLAEVIGEGGITVPPTDTGAVRHAMEAVLDDPAAHQKWATRGMAWQRQWTWQKSAAETVALYREIIA